ncbi:MAG: hypothetical protein OXC40_07430, partial [Proteobacteria bacterium]|nr:hypothetical protein [Pseudomonadota bacterium]
MDFHHGIPVANTMHIIEPNNMFTLHTLSDKYYQYHQSVKSAVLIVTKTLNGGTGYCSGFIYDIRADHI